MKKIIKLIINSIPNFKRRFSIFILSVIIAQGVALQILPFVDREFAVMVQKSINGEIIAFKALLPLILIALLAIGLHYLFDRISYNISDPLREDVWIHSFKIGFTKILYHDLEYVSQERSSSILSKLERASSNFANIFTESAAELFRNLTSIIVSLAIIMIIEWKIGIAILVVFVMYDIIYWIRFKADVPYASQKDKFTDKELTRVWEVVPQLKATNMFTNENKEIEHVSWIGKKIIEITKKRDKLWTLAYATEVPLVQAPFLFIKAWIALSAIQGSYGLPTFFLMFTLVGNIQRPMWIINWFLWEMQNTFERAKKYRDIMNSKVLINDPQHPKILANPKGDIVFDNVSFDYRHGQKNVLNNINITFSGKKVSALVGKSGAGKSTITNLICRFFDPTAGRLTIGGVDIKDVTKNELRSQIGFVMQDSFVFSGSVADNLRYAKADATDKELIAVCKKAQAWEFIKNLSEGLDTQIGERGVKLSGGQKQRLSIARTILKNPKILILDEATNALDSESEMAVQQALEEFMRDKTVIVVAHRLSTIQNADMIYVIEKGDISESGNHDQLIAYNGVYKMLYDIQSGGFDKQKKIMQEYELG